MSGWVRVFAIKMLSIISPLESNPWKIVLHVSTFRKTEYCEVITLLIVVINCIIEGDLIIALETHTVTRIPSLNMFCTVETEHLVSSNLGASEVWRLGPDKQRATSYTRFHSINTQPIVPDCWDHWFRWYHLESCQALHREATKKKKKCRLTYHLIRCLYSSLEMKSKQRSRRQIRVMSGREQPKIFNVGFAAVNC